MRLPAPNHLPQALHDTRDQLLRQELRHQHKLLAMLGGGGEEGSRGCPRSELRAAAPPPPAGGTQGPLQAGLCSFQWAFWQAVLW